MKKENKTSRGTAKRGKGRPLGSKDKKERKRKTRIKTAKEVIKKANRVIAKLAPKKEEKKCNIKVMAVIVKADGNSRFKIKKDKIPEIAPVEELICKITYERDGIPIGSVLNEVKRFAEALIQSMRLS